MIENDFQYRFTLKLIINVDKKIESLKNWFKGNNYSVLEIKELLEPIITFKNELQQEIEQYENLNDVNK